MLLEVSSDALIDAPAQVAFGARRGGDLSTLRRERLRQLGVAREHTNPTFSVEIHSLCPSIYYALPSFFVCRDL